MSTPQPQRSSSEIREYLRVLRERKRLVIIPAVVAVAVALVVSLETTKMYTASAQVLVTSTDQLTTSGSGANNRSNATLSSDRTLVASNDVVATALSTLAQQEIIPKDGGGRPLTEPQVAKHITATVPSGTNVLKISYTATDPEQAADVANALATAYSDFKSSQATTNIDQATSDLRDQLRGLQAQMDAITARLPKVTSKGVRTGLTNHLIALTSTAADINAQIKAIEAGNQTDVKVIDPAVAPRTASSPNVPMNVLAALALGLLLGIGLAFGAEALDDRLRSRSELQELIEAPVIGSIPVVSQWKREGGPRLAKDVDPNGPVAEAYKAMATNVMYLASQGPMQVVMVASAVPEEGKTTTAANLAVALAALDQDVVLVGMDLRAPALHEEFGVPNTGGMSSLLYSPLLGDVAPALRDKMVDVGVTRLRLLVAGPPTGEPTELVSEFNSGAYANALRSIAKFVVIDTPPVIGVADASILTALTDGVIFVADAQKSNRRAIRAAREQLETAGARIIGAVYNRMPGYEGTYGSYGYGRYAPRSDDGKPASRDVGVPRPDTSLAP